MIFLGVFLPGRDRMFFRSIDLQCLGYEEAQKLSPLIKYTPFVLL
jgi:hypothetical protein